MAICFTGGGTGGHLYSGIALAESWSAGEGAMAPQDLHFVGGTYGLEKDLLPRYPFPYTLLEVAPFRGSVWDIIKALSRLALALSKAFALLRKLKPKAVIGIGGYASVPTLLAAVFLGIPRFLIEQNATPGRANRLLAALAKRVFLHFEEARPFFAVDKIVMSGNPVRPGFRTALEKSTKEHVESRTLTLLVLGGSQGAHAVNELVKNWTLSVPADSPLRTTLSIVHQTGPLDFKALEAHYQGLDWKAGIEVKAFLDPVVPYYVKADLVIARAGAGTVCELAACGRPSILIPYPYAADNHQEQNARAMEKVGGARVFLEKEGSPQKLDEILTALLLNDAMRHEMGEKAKILDFPLAAETIRERVG